MAKLIYSAITSLDGYVEDARGHFDWAAPDAEVHAFVNDLERPIGTYLYGRRMYETMRFWEASDGPASQSEVTRDYAAVWQAADKVVFSRSLETASTARTRIERDFAPETVRALKASATADLSIGGAELAGVALLHGLVDELRLLVCPVIVGGGKPALPASLDARLELVDQRRFDSGVVHLWYRIDK